MLRISSAQYDASVLQTNSHALTATGTQPKETDSASTLSNQQDVTLSGRALGVQKLSQEFFSHGTKGFQITSDFVARLEEYGLINGTEASKLSPLISPMSRFKEQGDNSALNKVTQFIQDFRDELKKDKPDSKLIGTLDRAEKIIENFDGSQSTTNQTNIKSVLAELNSFYNSADAEHIAAEDKDALIQLGLTLRIADRLSPTVISSNKVNSYLSSMSRFY